MKRLTNGFLLAFASALASAAPENSVDGATPSNKVRTFRASLSVAGNDAVHFDAQRRALVICANGDERLCKQWSLKADDVLSFKMAASDATRLLVIDTPFSYRACTVQGVGGTAGLDCQRLGIAELLGKQPIAAGPSTLHLNYATPEEYQCGYTVQQGLLCSSAEQLKAKDGLLFGHFTGDPRIIQVLSVQREQVCDVGGGCRQVQGLGLLSSATSLASAKRASAKADRSQVLGIGDSGQTVCTAFFESPSRVGFACEQEVAESVGAALNGVVIYGRGSKPMIAVAYVNARQVVGPRVKPAERQHKAAQSRRGQLHDLAARSFRNAGGAMSVERFKAAAYVMDQPTFIKAKVFNDDFDFDFGNESFPRQYSFDWDSPPGQPDGGWDSPWSDIYNRYFIEWQWSNQWQQLTRETCLSLCDQDASLSAGTCDVWASLTFDVAVIGTVVVVAGSIGTGVLTGGGATAIAIATGLGVASSLSSWVGVRCKAESIYERDRCRRSC